MTGTAGACCARAASGHAAAKPVTLMRSRRLIVAPEAQTAMVAISAGALEGAGVVDVRFGSLADMLRCGSHVRFSGDCDRKTRHRLKGRMLLSSATGVQPCKTMQTSPYLHLNAPPGTRAN